KLQVVQEDRVIGARELQRPVPPPKDFALLFRAGDQVRIPSLVLDRSAPLTLEGYFTPHQARYPNSGRDAPTNVAIVLGFKFQTTLNIAMNSNSWNLGLTTAKGPRFAAAPFPIVKDRRTHVAGVRVGKEVRLYVDGKLASKIEVEEPFAEPQQ